MQHVPSAPISREEREQDWLPIVAYLLILGLLLVIVGSLLWPSLTAVPARDSAYVNPELRLAERYRAEHTPLYYKELTSGSLAHLEDPYWLHFRDRQLTTEQPAAALNLAVNPELKLLESYRAVPVTQDFAHANPEVGLFQRLQEFER